MLSEAEASARADAWVNAGDAGRRREVGLLEFDLGWVVWGKEPPPADRGRPPERIGNAKAVIDRATGELTTWPSLPAAEVARRYGWRRAAFERFPADVAPHLAAAGWHPGRQVPAAELDAFDAHLRTLPSWAPPEPGSPAYRLFDVARAALVEFGGLRVTPPSEPPFSFHPFGHDIDIGLLEGLDEMLGRPVAPLGARFREYAEELAIDVDGRVFVGTMAGLYHLADTLDDAVARLVRGPRGSLYEVTEDGRFAQLTFRDNAWRETGRYLDDPPDDAAPDDAPPDDAPGNDAPR